MADIYQSVIKKVLSEGVQLKVFSVDEGKENPNITKTRPLSDRERNAIQGIWTSNAKKPYIFVIFRGGGGGSAPPAPSGSAHGGNYW